jgi:hypothetical protein
MVLAAIHPVRMSAGCGVMAQPLFFEIQIRYCLARYSLQIIQGKDNKPYPLAIFCDHGATSDLHFK